MLKNLINFFTVKGFQDLGNRHQTKDKHYEDRENLNDY